MNTKKKTLLIGIDGGTFDIFLKWIENGLLPHMQTLLRESTWGYLSSTIPPTTPPAWASCVTGKNPGKHGVFDFRESPLTDRTRPLISSASVRSSKIWHILNYHGKKVGIFNVPITYPPEKVDGFMVSGMMTPSTASPYVYPETLKAQLLGAVGDYIPNIDIPRYDVEHKEDALEFLSAIHYCFEKRRDAFFYLMDNQQWNFFMAVFILHDRIQHLFWKYIDERCKQYHTDTGKLLRKKIIECYQSFDYMLGELLTKIQNDTDLFIISDHGFGETRQWFNVNRWLEDIGLLKVRPIENIKKKLFFRAMLLSNSPMIRYIIPKTMHRFIRKKVRQSRSTFKTDINTAIDWNKTRAFFASIPCQGIFINMNGEGISNTVNTDTEYETVRELIKEKLLSIIDPETEDRLVDQIWYREEIYSGPYTHTAPDIFFIAKNYSTLGRQHLGAPGWLSPSGQTPNGFHRSNGIFIAHGKNIKKNKRIGDISIVDIAPTILYSHLLPVPNDMDGRVIKEIFLEEYTKDHPVQYCKHNIYQSKKTPNGYSNNDMVKIEERLKNLGYIE